MNNMISSGQISKYPLTEYGADLERRMLEAIPKTSQAYESAHKVACCLFSCFMRVAGIGSDKQFLINTAIEFRGFLLVEVNGSSDNHDNIFRSFCRVQVALGSEYDYSTLTDILAESERSRQAYLRLKRDPHLLEYYAGWPVITLDEVEVWADFRELHRIHGIKTVRRFHRALKRYAKTMDASTFKQKRTIIVDIVHAMLTLITKEEHLKHLESPLSVNKIFEAVKGVMLVQYQTSHPGENVAEAFESKWRRAWVEIYGYFIGEGLVAEPLYPIPKGKIKNPVSRSSLPKDELEAVDSFGVLTPIPIIIQDEAAANRIYQSINEDLNLVKCACEEARAEILAAYWNRIHLASQGTVCTENDGTEKRAKLENRCRTWEEHNYHARDRWSKRNLYALRKACPPELALLSNSTLLPFFYLLVAEDPSITASWLVNFELYDKHGNLRGFENDKKIADSIKRRRGYKSAQQPIYLNDKSRQLFDEILLLTQQARDYLRESGDDDYRYLFLTGNGFSKPMRKKQCIPPMNDQTYAQSLLRKILLRKLKGRPDGEEFFDRITLKAMRTTAALKIYFETGRLRDMAEALGHKTLNRKTLEKYLPAQLLCFFLNRWIRIFQTAITFKAVAGRPCMHEAMGISTEHELQEFLKHHDLKPLPKYLMVGTYGLPEINVTQKSEHSQVVFPITAEYCTFVLSCLAAVDRLKAKGFKVTETGQHWWRTGRYLQMSCGLHESGQIRVYSGESLAILNSARYSEALIKVLTPVMTMS
ncbi:hypothetical protein [Pseudomonas putida]|uniref:hypothetical protein n=1 Tax=Pseudomonas putida TaxID=303 RepID=UPI0012603D85|nr:hypothetical protein [Pseudomonas putida]